VGSRKCGKWGGGLREIGNKLEETNGKENVSLDTSVYHECS